MRETKFFNLQKYVERIYRKGNKSHFFDILYKIIAKKIT